MMFWVRRSLAILGAAALLYFAVTTGWACLHQESHPPTAVEAPWLIQTSSKIYYAEEFMLDGDVPSIKGYWTMDGDDYNHHDGQITFTPASYGKVNVIRRGN